MTYPRQLYKLGQAELSKLGLYRDGRGRIRTKAGEYVCGVSGRVHQKKLYRVPDYDDEDDEWTGIWVDAEEAARAGLEIAGNAGGFGGLLLEIGRRVL